MVTSTLGPFLDALERVLGIVPGQRGGEVPRPPEGGGTTGIATNIPPTSKKATP